MVSMYPLGCPLKSTIFEARVSDYLEICIDILELTSPVTSVGGYASACILALGRCRRRRDRCGDVCEGSYGAVADIGFIAGTVIWQLAVKQTTTEG